MEKLKIVSLNLRIWTKHKNPFKSHFWLWRTLKQSCLFKVQNPDIICLQEVEKPVGKFLLGLWNYEVFGGKECRCPIFIKKSLLKNGKGIVDVLNVDGTTAKENGHGSVFLMCWFDGFPDINIQNCHYSWETDEIQKEYSKGFYENTIFCGDMNVSRDRFIENLKNYSRLKNEEFEVYTKHPAGPTYISYDEPLKYQGDIDQVGYVGKSPFRFVDVQVLPNKVSDHFPILATFEAD